MKRLLTIGLIAAVASLGSVAISAESAPKPADKAEKKERKSVPFHGKIESVDKAAKSIKVGERTFHATSATRFTKAGKAAIFDDLKAGEEIGGAYHEGEGGKLELVSLRIGPKPEAKEKKADEKKK